MKYLTFKDFWQLGLCAAGASLILSAIIAVISAADVFVREWNWNNQVFLLWWLILGLVLWAVWIGATIRDSKLEAEADNE